MGQGRPRPPAHHLLVVAAAVLVSLLPTHAGEVILKNGVRIEGKPVPVQGLTQALIQQSQGPTNTYPILLVDTPLQRYFIPARQTEEIVKAADLSRFEKFTLDQKKSGRKLMVASLGGYEATPFDEFGRRRVTLQTDRGPLHIVQGITEITPQHVAVTGLTHMWDHSLALTSLPPEKLAEIIRQATNPTNPDDRLAIVRFYLQAGLYTQGAEELETIVRDFPELKKTAEDVGVELNQLRAKQLLAELQRRKRAGQHGLAYAATQVFPVEGMSAAVLREVRELAADYEQAREQGDRAVSLLGELQSQLGDSAKVTAAASLRAAIADELDYESLPRLDAFLKLQGDASLAADEKLALAFTGWLMGANHAETDFDLAIRLWHVRMLMLEYCRTADANQRSQLLLQIQGLEGVGPDRIAQMIPLLPPPLESPEIVPGKIHRIELPAAKAVGDEPPPPPEAYHVLLPEGYNRHHAYPLIVALRPAGRPAADELVWWGLTSDGKPGQAQRHGYIVIAPEYLPEETREYDYSAAAHDVVLQSLNDARRRFHVDSDRVFLSGHGMGGDAAFDIGMSHPDLFAGVIPITGISDKICKWYWPNAKDTAWYVVSGELDRDSLERNSRELNRMLRNGYDLIYTEYVGRGLESYYEEIHKLFDWMALHRRVKAPKEIEAKVLRPSDNRFFWIEAAGFPSNVTRSTVLVDAGQRQRVAPMALDARVTPGNSIYISSGAASHTLHLSSDIINLDERVMVKVNGRQKFNDYLRPSIEALLEDFRLRGDRQLLYSVKLQCD